MPLRTETIDLEAEIERIDEERKELADKVAQGDPESSMTQARMNRGQQKDRYMAGLRWYIDEFGEETITLGALTNGERHRVKDTADAAGGGAARQNAYVAMGVREAAFVEHDADEIIQAEFEATTGNVADLEPGFVDWAERKLGDLSRMDGETGNSFRELVAERKKQED